MQELLALMKEYSLTPNQLYLLWCLHKGEAPEVINVHTELRKLKTSDLITEDSKLTPLGLDVASKIPDTNKAARKEQPVTDDYIDRYLNLFPKGKLPSGKQARADKKNIKNNFLWFFKNYKYKWETVLKATALYVDEYESKNYLYMKTSQYFISKMNPDRTRDSELANYCSMIVNNDYEDSSNFFSEKVV